MRELQPGRIRCCIMGCNRTFKMDPGDTEETRIVCGKHWRLADKALRHEISSLRRRCNRYGWSPARERRFLEMWERAFAQAQERALGI